MPARAGHALAQALGITGAFLKRTFGSISWSPPPWASKVRDAYRAEPGTPPSDLPPWLQSLIATFRARPQHFAAGAAGLVVVAIASWFGWQWYLHLPRPPEPERITFDVVQPAITDYERPDGTPTVIVHPLDIKFSASAAPIEKIGKTVTRGVTLEPALKGAWTWVDDRTLRFMPARDWPIGAHVEIRFDIAQTFAPHVLMADDHGGTDIHPFAVATGNGEFYQDPQNPAAKKTIMPLSFDYPVDPAELEKRISLELKGRDGNPLPLKFTVAYDAAKLKAWVHSQPLQLPRDSDTVVLTLAAGVRSARGGDPTQSPQSVSVGVPGLYSLSVSDVSPALVNNDRYEPEQVMVVNVSDSVRGQDLLAGAKAWVLPKRKAGHKQADDDSPYEWGTGEISDDLLKHSQPLTLDVVPTEREFAALQSFKYHADPGQRVYIRFSAGLKSFGGYLLGKVKSQTFTVPDYPRLLHFMADGSLLALSGEKRVSIVSRNEPGMRLQIGRVLPEQLQHLVSFNEGTYAKPELLGRFSEDHIVERFEETRAFPHAGPGEAHYEGIDLGQYLKQGRRGIFLLHLSAYDPAKAKKQADGSSDSPDDSSDSTSDDSSDQSDSDTRLIVVTDLGVLAKKSFDGSRDVFVQSIATGQPVGTASVAIIAVNGETLYEQTTSADGAAHFPSLKGLEHERRPVMYVVRKGDDLSFLPVDGRDRRLDYSRFDIGGEDNPTSETQLSAYLFSDRGIYRPGDLFHVGMIVRTASWAKSPAGIPLRAEIVDPRGLTVKKLPVTVDASGFTELAYQTSETGLTGTWTINLSIVGKDDEDAAIGSTTVSVKEFLPDTMKVDANLSAHVADGWVRPDTLKGIVDARNLFGSPAANRRVEASLTLNPTFPAFHDWPDFQFYDLRHAKDGYTTQLQDGRTDDKGHAEFDLDLKKYADATYRVVFLAKAYEAEGGRNVAATAETIVSSNPWLVGYKTADDLNYVSRGSHRSIRLVAVDPQTKSIELKSLTAQLIERRYVSVLTKQDSGVYKYESRLKEVPLSANALTIPAGGLDYALSTDKPGDYALLIKSADTTVNRIEYSVTGAANLSRSLERNAELEIKLNKDDFAPGEAVEVSLRAPYAGSGLITIERDRVYAHAWFTAATTNSVQHITVPKDFEGNGYINVQYIRDPSSDEVFMSPLSYGVIPFSVNVNARRNALSVEAPEIVKPGETATFRLKSSHPAKVVLFAVDEGILQVARYKLGDPLSYFFRKRTLDVQTLQILDLILPDFKKLLSIEAPGGDNGDAISRNLNPFKRRRDKPVAYWSGIVDVNGERDFQYAVPDYFHGKLHVMAVSVSPGLVGTTEAATTVRGDFVLSPDAPTTLAPGDEADVGVGVSNNLPGIGNRPVPVSIALRTGPQLQVVGASAQTLSLASGHESVATFRVRATGMPGSGTLTFAASYAGKSAEQRIEISVRPAAAYRSQIDIAHLEPGEQKAVLDLRHMYDAYSRRSAAISAAPVVMSAGLASFLANYDNYCSEQIISMAMPHLLASRWNATSFFSRSLQPVRGKAKSSDALAAGIDALRSRQNGKGGFGLWSATPDSEPFISAYAINFLLEARDRGVAVPKDMVDAGNRYLEEMSADEGLQSLGELRARAYAVYLLTRQGNVTSNNLAAVQKRLQEAFPNSWKNDLAAAWLASAYKLMKQDNAAGVLIAPLQKTLDRPRDSGSFSYEYYDDPLTQDVTVLYLLSKHFPERARSLSPRVLENISRPLEMQEFNTLSASMTMLALDSYASMNGQAPDRLGMDEIAANGKLKSLATVEGGLLKAGSLEGSARGIRFANGTAQPAWYVVDQEGYDRDISAKAIKNGLEIVREYTDTKDHALDRITAGEEIHVHVKIRTTGNKGVGDVAIVDLLPGGFDPVMETPAQPPPGQSDSDTSAGPTIRLSGSTWSPVYIDVREDRVVIYGSATSDVQEFVYRIKASAPGKFIVPPAYAESMYDRRVQARAPGGDVLNVARVP